MKQQRDPLATLTARCAAHASWANTTDRTARTAPARAGLQRRFLEQAGGDPVRAESFRKAFYAQLALKSAKARRARARVTPIAPVPQDSQSLEVLAGDAA